MNSILIFLMGVVAAIAGFFALSSVWSFSAQQPKDYAALQPTFDIREHLKGTFQAEGLVVDYTGRVNERFVGRFDGKFDEQGGRFAETFTYSSGIKDKRAWTIKFTSDKTFTATADDVVGQANGVMAGNTTRMSYRLRLPERAGGHELDVIDWMYLQDSGTILNRAEMRKFGIKVAELFVVFRKEAVAQ